MVSGGDQVPKSQRSLIHYTTDRSSHCLLDVAAFGRRQLRRRIDKTVNCLDTFGHVVNLCTCCAAYTCRRLYSLDYETDTVSRLEKIFAKECSLECSPLE